MTASPNQIVETVLRAYPLLAPVRIIPYVCPLGFSGAQIVRIRSAGREWCLRAWPAAMQDTVRLGGLHRLTRHVFEQGVTEVAVPLPSRTGGTLVQEAGRYWQIEPWMPGTADFAEAPTDARLADAMRCLAWWHAAARTFCPGAGETAEFGTIGGAPSPAVRDRLKLIDESMGGRHARLRRLVESAGQTEFRGVAHEILDGFERAAGPVAARLRAVSQQCYPLQPCLRDVWHDHLLLTGDRVTGLIDPSACRTENVATDLARLLGSLLEDDCRRWPTALEAYQRYRPLMIDELALVEILDQSGVLLSGLTWLGRIYERHEVFDEPYRVLRRLDRIRRRLLRLCEAVGR